MSVTIRLLGTDDELEAVTAELTAAFGHRLRFKDALPARQGWRWYFEVDPPAGSG